MAAVTVIIPAYNAARWIARSVDSVRGQTFRDIEIVCVDDGSADGTGEALAGLARADARVRVVAQRNGGMSAARNRGLDCSASPFVYFLDADDAAHPRLLAFALGALARVPEAAFCLFDYAKVSPDAPVRFADIAEPPCETLRAPLRAFLRENESPDVWRFVYRREALAGFRFVPGLRYEDLDFTFRFLRCVPCGLWLHAPLYAYVQTPGSQLRHPFTLEDAQYYAWVLRHLRADYAEAPRERRLLRRTLFPRVVKAMWKSIVWHREDGARPDAALVHACWGVTRALFRERVVCRRDFSPKWRLRFAALEWRYRQAEETLGNRLGRTFWKAVAAFLPHRSPIGRIVRARGCKRAFGDDRIRAEFGRARQIFEEFDPETEVLCLGTSHVERSIRPAAVRRLRFWNAGFINGDYRMCYHVYRALRERWPARPGQVVLMSDNFWLPSHQAEYTENFIQSVYLHLLIGMPYRNAFLMGKHERRVRKWLRERIEVDCVRGYTPLAPEPTVVVQAKRVAGHIRRSRYAPVELPWFARLREAVEADGRRLVLFRAPLREDYRAALAAGDGADVWASGAEARRGLTLLDYSELPLPADCWHDADHLNARGATAFTQELEHALEPLCREAGQTRTGGKA